MYSYIVYMLHWIVYNRAKNRCKMYIENIETEEKCWVKNCTWLKVEKCFLALEIQVHKIKKLYCN